MHPPKVSRYDLAAETHTVASGSYPVDRYEKGDGWLYLARPFVGHPHIAYMEAYLLPALGLQVNFWQHQPGSSYAWYDFYVDVMVFETGECWTSRDFYLDIVVVEERAAYIVDTDEFLAAQIEGLLTPDESAYALNTAHALLNGLAKCGYSLRTWLKSTVGLEVTF